MTVPITPIELTFYPKQGAECDFCGISSFTHIHRKGTTPKEFEQITDLQAQTHQHLIIEATHAANRDQQKTYERAIVTTVLHRLRERVEKLDTEQTDDCGKGCCGADVVSKNQVLNLLDDELKKLSN